MSLAAAPRYGATARRRPLESYHETHEVAVAGQTLLPAGSAPRRALP